MDSVSRQLMMGGLKETLPGQQIFTASSIFVVPAGVTSISVVCVGRGSTGANEVSGRGGGGGALSYSNNIVVFPGESLTVTLSSIEGEYSSVARGGEILVSARNASAGAGGGNGVGTVFRGGSSTGGPFKGVAARLDTQAMAAIATDLQLTLVEAGLVALLAIPN